MFFPSVLTAFSLLGAASAAAPNSGTSSGYSVFFQGDGDIAALKTAFADSSSTDKFPSVLEGQTFSAWIKTSVSNHFPPRYAPLGDSPIFTPFIIRTLFHQMKNN
jgi:hypothetical protein